MKNIYFAVFPTDRTQKRYMFSCPMGKGVRKGRYYIVKFKNGKKVVKAITDSIVIRQKYVIDIMIAFGIDFINETVGEHITIENDVVWREEENGDVCKYE